MLGRSTLLIVVSKSLEVLKVWLNIPGVILEMVYVWVDHMMR
jgi:hypothetical protein